MLSKENKLVTGKPYKLLLKIGLSSALISLLDEINGMVDAFFMGKYFGEEALSSMAVIFPFLLIISSFGILFSEGAGIAISRYMGADDLIKSNEFMNSTITITIITGIIIGFLSYLSYPVLLRFYELSPLILYYTEIYIEIFCFGLPVIMLSITLSKIVYTEGHTAVIIVLSAIQILLNIVINYILMEYLSYNIQAIALATILTILFQCILLIRYIQSDKIKMKLKLFSFRLHPGYFKEVIPLGLPSFSTMILLSLTMGLESNMVSSFGGTALSVQTITGYIFSATSSVTSGIMGASLILMSYSAGAKKIGRFYHILKLSLIFVFSTTVVLNLPLIIDSPYLVGLLTDSVLLNEMIRIPALIYGLSAPFIFTTNVILYAMQPVGLEKTSLLIFSLQQVFIFIPLIFLMKDFGLNAVLSAQPAAEVVGGIITIALLPFFINKVKQYFISGVKS